MTVNTRDNSSNLSLIEYSRISLCFFVSEMYAANQANPRRQNVRGRGGSRPPFTNNNRDHRARGGRMPTNNNRSHAQSAVNNNRPYPHSASNSRAQEDRINHPLIFDLALTIRKHILHGSTKWTNTDEAILQRYVYT